MESYSILYNSNTGNTQKLAKAIKKILPTEKLMYFGKIDMDKKEGDIIFVGFWTDKGSCTEDVKSYLKQLINKKIFLFGTAGFGGDENYFQTILDNVNLNINSSSEIVGSYMCQGKMPISVRKRYESMMKDNLLKAQGLIDNFDKAAIHPNQEDIKILNDKVKEFLL